VSDEVVRLGVLDDMTSRVSCVGQGF
jgi:hypothetical protein